MNDARPTGIRYLVMGLLCLMAVLGYVCRNAVGVAEQTIRESVGISKTQSGQFMGAFFWSYALLQVPMGIMGKRYGSRLTLMISAACWGLGSILIGLGRTFEMLVLAQILMGIGQAAMFPCAVQVISHWIPPARRASFSSLMPVGMQVGAVVTASLTGWLLSDGQVSWRWIFIAYGIPSLLWALVFYGGFRNRPWEDRRVNETELLLINGGAPQETRPGEMTPSSSWVSILLIPSTWFFCFHAMGRAAGYIFFATWYPTFLKERFAVDTAQAGNAQALGFAMFLLGSFAGGVIVDWVFVRTGSLRLSRQGVALLAMTVCAAFCAAAWRTESFSLTVTLLCGAMLWTGMVGSIAYVASIDLGGDHLPQLFGLMNMSGNLAAAATTVLIGKFLDSYPDVAQVLGITSAVYFVSGLAWLGITFPATPRPEVRSV